MESLLNQHQNKI